MNIKAGVLIVVNHSEVCPQEIKPHPALIFITEQQQSESRVAKISGSLKTGIITITAVSCLKRKLTRDRIPTEITFKYLHKHKLLRWLTLTYKKRLITQPFQKSSVILFLTIALFVIGIQAIDNLFRDIETILGI